MFEPVGSCIKIYLLKICIVSVLIFMYVCVLWKISGPEGKFSWLKFLLFEQINHFPFHWKSKSIDIDFLMIL